MMKICTLLLLVLATCFSSMAKNGPEIQFDSLTHDFGTIHESNGAVDCVFTYVNIGDAPLSLASVSAPCNCTKAKFSPKPIQPGDSAEITVTFTPKDMSGEFMRTISVWTNIKKGTKKKKVTLRISGVVIPAKQHD